MEFVNLAVLVQSGKQSADLQSVCVGMCIHTSLCAGKDGLFFL